MDDAKYIRLAISEAQNAYSAGEKKGIGAIIVGDNDIIGRGHNNVKQAGDPTAHAEINAIRDACRKLKDHRLDNCFLYTTCEPCPMCFTAAWWARVSRIVYGASLSDLVELGYRQIEVSCEYLNDRGTYRLEILGGILRDECIDLCNQHKK